MGWNCLSGAVICQTCSAESLIIMNGTHCRSSHFHVYCFWSSKIHVPNSSINLLPLPDMVFLCVLVRIYSSLSQTICTCSSLLLRKFCSTLLCSKLKLKAKLNMKRQIEFFFLQFFFVCLVTLVWLFFSGYLILKTHHQDGLCARHLQMGKLDFLLSVRCLHITGRSLVLVVLDLLLSWLLSTWLYCKYFPEHFILHLSR